MKIRFNAQMTSPELDLTLQARLITTAVSATLSIDEGMTPVSNALGLYETDEISVAAGDYYVHIFNDTGDYETVLFLRAFEDGKYNLVASPDDFNREISTEELEDQLDDEFENVPGKRPTIR